MPTILIRTDMGREYGLGHAVRMRALASELAARGALVRFLTTTPALEAFVAPFACETRSPKCLPLNDDIFVVDTKEPWIQVLTSKSYRQDRVKVVRIDHPDASPDSCDLLIAPVNHWHPDTVARLRHAFGPRFLYGWDYVMLATEVTSRQPIPYQERWPRRIVVCAGGSDHAGTLPRLWDWMYTNYEVPERLFLIPQHASYQLPRGYSADVIKTSEGHGWPKLTGQLSIPFDSKYLQTASLVITMFGVMCYECLWYKTPMMVFPHTKENAVGARGLETVARSLIWNGGRLHESTQSQFCKAVAQVYNIHQQCPPQAHTLMDGRGVERVVTAIMELV